MPKKDYPSRDQRMKELTQRLEQGIREVFDSEKYLEYLTAMSRFHHYSARNILLIQMQRPNASLVASAKKWREQFGRHINRGEKAIYIVAPAPFVKKVEREKLDPDTKAPMLDENGHVIMEEKELRVPLFRPVPVFDVSQTGGRPLPQLAEDLTGDVRQYEVFMEALARSAPVPIAFEPMAENMDGYFFAEQHRIAIRAGMSQVQTISAAVHEITHSILHGQKDEKSRSAEELEAESVSYVVCQYYGIETGANSFGYLASWSKDRELSELRTCLDTISKTANGLITDIDRHFSAICKERGLDFSLEENSPNISANFQEADTPEQFSADFLDYMAELESAGVLKRPYSLDSREQTEADIVEELRAGHFAVFRDDLDHAYAQTGAPAASVLRDRLERLSDERDKGLRFRLETNPHAVSYQDQSYLQAAEWTGADDIPREVVYVGPTDRCRELLHQLEAGELTARQVRELDQTEPRERVEELQESQPEPPDTVLDTYPMPDSSLTVEDLAQAGYLWDDLLPVSLETAELMYGGDFTVYLIRPGEDLELVFDETDFDRHTGLCAVPREEWEASPDFDDAIQSRLREEEQEKREAAFLNHQGDCFALYQLHRGPDLRDIRYISLEQLRAEGESPRKGNYDLVYTAPLTGQGDTLQQLNQLWEQFNIRRLADYHSPSMSISDIVALKQGGVVSCHYVDQYAFSELPGFFSGKNPLRAVEDSIEQNDNQLDGIINNTPSAAELEAQARAGQPISLLDLAHAVQADQGEKKKSVAERLKQPPQPGHKKTAPDRGAERER